MERTIRELEERVKQEALVPHPVDTRPTKEQLAYDRSVRDLKRQLDDIDRQLKCHEEEAAELRSELAGYQARIEAFPTRESELVELTRDYDTLQHLYTGFAVEAGDSKLAANLERRQIGEQFRILDAASFPERPYNQRNRMADDVFGRHRGPGSRLAPRRVSRIARFELQARTRHVANAGSPGTGPGAGHGFGSRASSPTRRTIVLNVAGSAMLIGSVVFVVVWSLQA